MGFFIDDWITSFIGLDHSLFIGTQQVKTFFTGCSEGIFRLDGTQVHRVTVTTGNPMDIG